MDEVIVPASARFAPAKVNLALHVVGRRDDGYHLLESLVTFDQAAGDMVAAAPRADLSGLAAGDLSDRLTIDGRFAAGLPTGPANILVQAAALARKEFRRFGLDLPPLDIRLTKTLPVAAGIGGGSADAAALLTLLCQDIPGEARNAVFEAAIRLGADVPMCLDGRPALVSGIGETIRPLAGLPELPLLLVNPGIAVETATVFRMLARRDNPPMPEFPSPGLASIDDLVAYLAETRNDLALAAGSLAPEIEDVRGRLLAAGALFARMSGSGATVYGLFADRETCAAAARMIAGERPGWWLSLAQADAEKGTTP
ncbi:4-(cytidine 5'-diphospho)-2-C-methyl-D-erythritol kinase [Jiella endophytica]|uniref:4-diphosphocytidyl-2-C-methyl-D-erythritol kinase n=1 Tax=Jiella endophytica TaxID=2558362 RepID=A0A4Y8RP26_9HYPH|nr:4-(cytidine 5'-diphospho)-2-C-methyl-D-erythritol kinase [Jiella endophytica]TFF25402.1 4-(cytidine 5'-diphospho)-2-C-methyl-D-erythritol kinase [Jiella endophytica]